jgi:hypothetical protein
VDQGRTAGNTVMNRPFHEEPGISWPIKRPTAFCRRIYLWRKLITDIFYPSSVRYYLRHLVFNLKYLEH